MASIGRFAFAGVSTAVEVTNALASVNIDFSLVKIDPPHEFRDVGRFLAPKRRDTAEDGILHITARRLGAIFEAILPETPQLIKAYGQRASEIMSASSKDSPPSIGIFAQHAGIDAASIWAGATSGSGAIQVHLLACMLARMWNGPEAISIWVELLNSRRIRLEEEFRRTGTMDMRTMIAAKQQIDRAHLGEWDASARAWLRIADIAKNLQQKQLLPILWNLDRVVNSKPLLYDSVMKAWTTGMEGMEALLQGSPMMMQTGDMPLALSSWHIYPDLNIVSNTTNKLVRQKDRLFPPSGILTIGLERQDSASSKGIQWSLPLAHLRYYGDPVTRVSELTIQGSRLSLLDFDMAVLGCVLGSWGITDCDPDAIKWISTASDLVGRTYAEESHEIDTTWLRILGKTASEFLKSKDAEKQRFTKLLYLGIGRCSFIVEEEAPFFGLTILDTLIRMMRTTEQRIRVLRAHAQRAGIRFEQAVIWYISDSSGREEFASAVPRNRSTIKRPSPESGSSWSKTSVSHVRWVHQAYTQLESQDDGFVDPPAGVGVRTYTAADEKNKPMEKNLIADKTYPIVRQEQQADGALHQARYQDEAMSEEVLPVEAGEIQALFELDKEVTRPSWTNNKDGSSKPVCKDPYGVMTRYGLWVGDFEIASMFVRSDHEPAVLEYVSMVSGREMVSLFEQDEIDPEAFTRELVESFRSSDPDYIKKLQAYSTMHSLYSTLGQVTIDVRVLEKDLSTQWILYLFQADTIKPGTSTKDDQEPTQNRQGIASRDKVSSGGRGETEHKAPREGLAWEVLRMRVNSPDMPSRRDPMVQGDTAVKELLRLTGPVEMTENQAFLCILMFETSYLLFPSRLEGVMAISSGNSLFIASSLLSDPYSLPSEPKISHVMGNIGRPGTLFLVPPVQPRMIAPGIERWPLLTFRDWDGVGNDSFPDSSLHLWFTGSTQEINQGYDGAHDQELCMIESVVSLHDKGEWIADLDILKVLRQSQRRLDRQNETIPPDVRRRIVLYEALKERRAETCCEEKHISQYSPQKLPLKAIETWWELLETSSKDCVFLAAGNWQARLAAMIICFAQGRKVSIISSPVCWDCVADARGTLNKPEDPIVYIY